MTFREVVLFLRPHLIGKSSEVEVRKSEFESQLFPSLSK